MKKSDKGIINALAYGALVLIACMLLITRLLPVLGVQISGPLVNILATIQNVLVLVVIGFYAYCFAENNRKWVKVLYWISVIVYVVATVLLWIK